MFGSVIRLNPFGLVVLLALVFFFIYMYMDGSPPVVQEERISMKRLLAVAVDIAELGGREVMEVRKGADLKEKSKGKTKEGANDPLTEGDLRSHRVMTFGFKNAFPNLRVISEEHEGKLKGIANAATPLGINVEIAKLTDSRPILSDVTVWIDPLDATQEYTENLLQYVTTMVCISIQGKPVIGVIHEPYKNQTVWGWVDQGISPNLNLATKPLEDPTVIVSRSHGGQVEKVVKESFGDKAKVVLAGGAGYKILQVLQGKANAYVHITNIKKWDTCAGHAILSASKGQLTMLNGAAVQYELNGDVVIHGGILGTLFDHETYLDKLKDVKI